MSKIKALYAETVAWAKLRPEEACIIAALVIVFVLGAFAGRLF